MSTAEDIRLYPGLFDPSRRPPFAQRGQGVYNVPMYKDILRIRA